MRTHIKHAKVRRLKLPYLFHHISFPRGAGNRVTINVIHTCEVAQAMKNAAIAPIDLWHFHQSFFYIHKKCRQLVNEKCTFQKVEVPVHRHSAYAKRSSKHFGIPDSTVKMSQHAPEISHG